MKKFGLFLPPILGAALLTVWLLARSGTTAPRPASDDSRQTPPVQSAEVSRDPKKAVPLPQPQVVESPELKETRKLLAELSDLAKKMEHDGVWIQQFRTKTSQPDATMWKLRVLGHRHPEAMKLIEQYVRSDEPLPARVFSVFSFMAPQSAETIEFVASLMRDPPSSALANAACLCCEAFAANGIGGAWDTVFGSYAGMLGFPKPRLAPQDYVAYGEGHALVYTPEDWQAHEWLYKSNSWKLDLTPIVSAVLLMLSEADDDVWRNKWLNMAWRMMNHPRATAEDRERLRGITERWYLEYDPGSGWDPKANGFRFGNGWFAAMEALTKDRSQRGLQVVADGLARLGPDHKTYVFDEVASRARSGLFEPPFVDHLEDVLTRLDRKPEEGGPQKGTYMIICVALIVHTPSEEWSRQLLSSRGAALRQRVADGIASWATGGDYKEDYGRRFFAASSLLIQDADFDVRLSAAWTLQGLTTRRNVVLSREDAARATEMLEDWIKSESAREMSAQESGKLKSFVQRLQR